MICSQSAGSKSEGWNLLPVCFVGLYEITLAQNFLQVFTISSPFRKRNKTPF